MKLDYELIEKIGATHYNPNGYFVVYYKVDGNCVEFYHDTEQKMTKSLDSSEYFINNLKSIPPRPKPECAYAKVGFKYAWEAVKAFEDGITLFDFHPTEGYRSVSMYQAAGSYENLYIRREVKKSWSQKVVDLVGDEDITACEQTGHIEFTNSVIGFGEDYGVKLAKAILKASGQ